MNYGGQGNKSVDVTNFSSIYSSAWPGNFGVIATFTLPTNRYVSAAFSVPANYMTASNVPNPMYGLYQIGETSAVAPTSMSISTKCGDFSNPATNANSSVVPGCWLNNGAADYFVRWSNTGSCTLANNQAYFLNIITANISNVLPLTGNNAGGTATSSATARCSSACTVPIQNGPGTWQGYVPN
ncbi:MAG: hypothetical protein P4L92_19620 [Rudaea sp.]|nr:hypothetical protein [Rudaea sp.]